MTALLDFSEIDLLGEDTVVSTPAATPDSGELPLPSIANEQSAAKSPRQRKSKQQASGLLYFDLEAIPDYDRFEKFGLDPIPEPAQRTTVEAMGNDLPSVLLKKTLADIADCLTAKSPCEEYLIGLEKCEKSAVKPRKGVFDAIAKVRGLDDARLAAIEAQRKQMATSPEMCQIVAMGWAVGDQEPVSMITGEDGVTEKMILERFWVLAKSVTRVIGFNILGYDLPVIFVRSMLLGVEPSRQFDLKPWGNDCIDLMKVRWPGPAGKLKWLASALGIEIPAGDVDGSQVEELYKTNRPLLGQYVRSDVVLLQQLHAMYRGFFCS